jgi:hypothetical protein
LKWNLDIQITLPDKIEEVLMDEECHEELEETDELMESHVQSSSSSEDEDNIKETELCCK